jgi:hypothetical protein
MTDALAGSTCIVRKCSLVTARRNYLPGFSPRVSLAGPGNERFLRSLGIGPVTYGDGLEERLRAVIPNGLDAFIDLFGGGYIELALKLGVQPQRINTIIDFAGAAPSLPR